MAEKQTICRICRQPFYGYAMGEKNGYKLVACKACGSVMAEPWPTAPEIEKFFGDVQPEIVHIPNPTPYIASMKRFIFKIAGNPAGRRFLDISCRQGYAVMAAKDLGFHAKGIDPNDFFIAFAKDKYDSHLFEHISMQDYAERKEKADVIFSVESLAEQTDPEGYISALSKTLAPGGILYLQEPDGNSFHLPNNFAKWPLVDPPINFAYFSKKGVAALLARHGLKIRKSLFTWGPFMRLIVAKG